MEKAREPIDQVPEEKTREGKGKGVVQYLHCVQCGLCCKVFGDRIAPTLTDLFRWLEDQQWEILSHFRALHEDGSWVVCRDLTIGDLGDVVSIEVWDSSAASYPVACPFLRRIDKTTYCCAIHSDRPEMCRNYQPWVWGETYFPRCPSVRK